MITVAANPQRVTLLGRVGENEYRQVQFPVGEYLTDYPDSTFKLLNQRPGDSAAYPVENVAVEGETLNWTISSADVSASGQDKCELVVMDGNMIAKSVYYLTQVLPALDDSGDAPDPWESWLTQFEAIRDAAIAAQTAAEAAVEAAQKAAEQAAQYAYRVYVDGTALVFEKVVGRNDEQNDKPNAGVI